MGWFLPAAILGSSILGAGATIFGASKAASSQKSATSAAMDAQNRAIDMQWKMYQQNREDYAPWREAGTEALGDLASMIRAGPGEFVPTDQPGYEFGFKHFIENPYLSAQGAKGKRLSGETAKGLIGYAQDYAGTSYDNFLRRYYQKTNQLAGLAGVGQAATGATVQAATQAGSNISGLQQNIGNIQAQHALGMGDIATGGAAGIAGIGQQGIQNWMNYNFLKNMFPGTNQSAPLPSIASMQPAQPAQFQPVPRPII